MSPEHSARRLSLQPEALLRLAIAALLLALVAAGFARAWTGVDLLQHVHWLPCCPFRALTGVPCPGCGMTHAFLLLSQLQVAEALKAHPAAPPLLLGMGWWALRSRPRGSARHSGLWGAALVLVLALWVARLAGQLPTPG